LLRGDISFRYLKQFFLVDTSRLKMNEASKEIDVLWKISDVEKAH
jgi:hypothetical protein